jgi:hypothetical protein
VVLRGARCGQPAGHPRPPQGGIILLLRRDPTLRAVTRDDLERMRAEAQREAAGAR